MRTEDLFATILRRCLIAFLLLIALAFLQGGAHVSAQNAGVVGIGTGELQIFNAQAANGSSGGTWQCLNSTTPIACPVFPDKGYGANFLSYCNTSFVGTIDLEWSPNANSTYLSLAQATYSSADSACHTLQVGGYFPNMRSTVSGYGGGSISAWYTASSAPIPLVTTGLGSNGPSAPINCDLGYVFSNATGTTNAIATPINIGDTIVICGMTVSFTGATSNGLLSVQWATSTGCSSLGPPTWEIITESTTPQVLIDPIAQRAPNSGRSVACVANTSGATALVAISYASVHGL